MTDTMTGGGSRPAAISKTRIADQIIDDLRTRIADGSLPRGGRMPTERELALTYGVSSQTVREAVRALSSIGLVEVRHGSGAYVAESSGGLLDGSLGMLVQWDNVSALDLIGLLRVLNLHVADIAVKEASSADIARVRAAAKATRAAANLDEVTEKINQFLIEFISCAHRPLLDALCGFLVRRLVELEMTSHPQRPPSYWKKWASDTSLLRIEIVDSLESRDPARLSHDVDVYHRNIEERIASWPDLSAARVG